MKLEQLKIFPDDHEWLSEEQIRLKKATGNKPNQAELFHTLREIYEKGSVAVDPAASDLIEAFNNGPTAVKVQLRSALSEYREFRQKAQEKASRQGSQHGREDRLRQSKTA